jgi:hypothetical protein
VVLGGGGGGGGLETDSHDPRNLSASCPLKWRQENGGGGVEEALPWPSLARTIHPLQTKHSWINSHDLTPAAMLWWLPVACLVPSSLSPPVILSAWPWYCLKTIMERGGGYSRDVCYKPANPPK